MKQFPLSRETKSFFEELQRLHEHTDIFAASIQPRHPEFGKVSAAVNDLALSVAGDLRAHLGLEGEASVTAELGEGPDEGSGPKPMVIITFTVGCRKRYVLYDQAGFAYYLFGVRMPCYRE
ncbi:hypothetical protein [Paraburkholderia sp. CI3]|uniref:hypothetical protein n=1 Tax=Paraburkholderia sp. CI3 TaxID=2991060 RepID=UPI003D20AF03